MRNLNSLAIIGTAFAIAACGSEQESKENTEAERRQQAADNARQAMHPALKDLIVSPDGSLSYEVDFPGSSEKSWRTPVKIYCEGKDLITLTPSISNHAGAGIHRQPDHLHCDDGKVTEAEVSIKR